MGYFIQRGDRLVALEYNPHSARDAKLLAKRRAVGDTITWLPEGRFFTDTEGRAHAGMMSRQGATTGERIAFLRNVISHQRRLKANVPTTETLASLAPATHVQPGGAAVKNGTHKAR